MLTPKQEAFCLAYVETGNASEAYRRAYSARNMSAKTVWEKASRLLSEGKVRARLDELRAAVANETIIKEARVIEEVARIGLFDPGRMFDENGALLPIHKMPADVRAGISSIEVSEIRSDDGETVVGHVKKIKLWDKNSALEKIMKHKGMFVDRKEIHVGPLDNLSHAELKALEEVLRGIAEGGTIH